MMAKEKAILHAELEAQRLKKLQMEKQLEAKTPGCSFEPADSEDPRNESAFIRMKHEMEMLTGEVTAGYKFVTELPTTSRSSNSAGEGGVSAPCSSRIGNACTPRTRE